jgi:hypothetical protein
VGQLLQVVKRGIVAHRSSKRLFCLKCKRLFIAIG